MSALTDMEALHAWLLIDLRDRLSLGPLGRDALRGHIAGVESAIAALKSDASEVRDAHGNFLGNVTADASATGTTQGTSAEYAQYVIDVDDEGRGARYDGKHVDLCRAYLHLCKSYAAVTPRPEAATPQWKPVSENDPTRGVAWIDLEATHVGKYLAGGGKVLLRLPPMNGVDHK